MGKTVSNPKKHVVSFRVSDEELEALLAEALLLGISLTKVARQRVVEVRR